MSLSYKRVKATPSLVKEILMGICRVRKVCRKREADHRRVHAGAAGSSSDYCQSLSKSSICTLYEQGKKGDLTNPKELEEIFQDLKNTLSFQLLRVNEVKRGAVIARHRSPSSHANMTHLKAPSSHEIEKIDRFRQELIVHISCPTEN